MENPNNINIGDQEFQHVGKMEAEATALKNAPKTYDLYQDTESGALAGKLPEGHPDAGLYFESKIENLDIDLSAMTNKDIQKLLEDESIKIYGSVNGGSKEELYSFRGGFGNHFIANKATIEATDTKKEYNVKGGIQINVADITVRGKNKIDLFQLGNSSIRYSNTPNTSATLSFYEIPEGYKQLAESKKAE